MYKDELKKDILDVLYEQVKKGRIPHIKSGIVDDLVLYVSNLLEKKELDSISKKMIQKQTKESTEGGSDV